MPELGRDPIQEMNEILKDPLNEGKQKQSDQKVVQKGDSETTGS